MLISGASKCTQTINPPFSLSVYNGEIVIEPIEEAKRRQQAIRDEMDSLLKSNLEEKQRLEEMREAAKEREEQYKQYEEDMIRERQELQEKFEEQQRQQREEEGKQKEYEKKRCKEMADEVNNKWQRIRRRITLKENPEWEEVERLSLNGEFSDDEEDQHRSRYDLRPKRHFPLLYKGYKRTYVPWSFADLKGLVEQLPSINDGGQKWITAFEERTAGQRLAIGDIKAILSQTIGVGKVKMEAILGLAHMATFATTQDDDDKSFDPYRNSVWDAIRKEYPSVMDPSQLETMELKPGACVNDFISSFQKKWLEETGSSWNQTETNQRLFQMMLKRSMPQEVQNALDEVVGLHNMEWKVFKDHVIHHVERYRKKKEHEKESNEKLATRLQQAQLNELKKKDKKKEDTANQAAVITPQGETITPKQQDQVMFTPQEQVITQAAVVMSVQ